MSEKKDDATQLDENLTALISNLRQSNINRRIIKNVNFNDDNITNQINILVKMFNETNHASYHNST